MDRDGNGDEILLDNVFDSMIQKPSLRNFNKELFTGNCLHVTTVYFSRVTIYQYHFMPDKPVKEL